MNVLKLDKRCHSCGNSQMQAKEIEIRRINSYTMAIASREQLVEYECKACGLIQVHEPMAALSR